MSMSLESFYKEPLPNIALIGKLRAGKDEVHKTLEGMGFNVKRVAFGDFMKAEFFRLFPHIPKDPKPVKELQEFNFMTKIYDRVWVDKLINHIEFMEAHDYFDPESESWIVTDTRQPHEYNAMKEAGFIIVKVDAPEEVRVKRALAQGETITPEMLNAETERHIDTFDYDYKIDNSKDQKHLHREVTELVYQIQLKRGL